MLGANRYRQMALTARNATRPTDHRACSWRMRPCCSSSSSWRSGSDGGTLASCAWSWASGPTSSIADHFHVGLLHRGDLVRIVPSRDHEEDRARTEQRQEQEERELQPFGATATQLTRE